MDNLKIQECTICSEQKLTGQVWFLVAESRWEDKLKVLAWQEELAGRRGVYSACCASHVEELVVHWMTTGSLDYPFATVGVERAKPRTGKLLPIFDEPDTLGARQIGELSVDRESVSRALKDDPQALQVILDELYHALEREMTGSTPRLESADAISYGFPREI